LPDVFATVTLPSRAAFMITGSQSKNPVNKPPDLRGRQFVAVHQLQDCGPLFGRTPLTCPFSLTEPR
ncbi:hypothetical protein ABZ667_44210, partial [Streptomyces lavendulae]|uniref:hypothetical protein n=1 Tax=Streptomyces lavendulae TaxID=1914 RepID=UPI0033D06A49